MNFDRNAYNDWCQKHGFANPNDRDVFEFYVKEILNAKETV